MLSKYTCSLLLSASLVTGCSSNDPDPITFNCTGTATDVDIVPAGQTPKRSVSQYEAREYLVHVKDKAVEVRNEPVSFEAKITGNAIEWVLLSEGKSGRVQADIRIDRITGGYSLKGTYNLTRESGEPLNFERSVTGWCTTKGPDGTCYLGQKSVFCPK